MDGHVDRVGGHEGREGIVDGDGVNGVTAVEDVAEADVVCRRVNISTTVGKEGRRRFGSR